MSILFGIGAAVLYIVGWLFQWDYVESSVHICVEWVPTICTLSVLVPLIYSIVKFFKTKKKLNISFALYSIFIFILYFLVMAGIDMYYMPSITQYGYDDIYNFSYSYSDVFNKVKYDLEQLARFFHCSYYTINVIIYMVIFPLIVVWNAVIKTMLVKKYNKPKPTELQ